MQRFYRLFAAALTAAVLFPGCSTPTTAEEFASGGSAAQPAIAAYESWMQFASPDTHTPAIDTDGCLNYALAKMSVRYHLPVSGVNLLSDSYTYYTAFTNQILSGSGTKMDQVADAYSAYLTREETVWLSGSMEERMEQAYTVCAENGSNAGWCCILQMTTASGSDHYVLADYADTAQKRLYLLDSGSWYVEYLGDAKTLEKGYFVTAVHPFQIQKMAGDLNGDFQLTSADVELLMQNRIADSLVADANFDGTVDSADAVYLAHAVQYTHDFQMQCAMQTNVPVATATRELVTKQPVSSPWNGQIFQKQLMP